MESKEITFTVQIVDNKVYITEENTSGAVYDNILCLSDAAFAIESYLKIYHNDGEVLV